MKQTEPNARPRKSRRRTRSPHPGIVLIKPAGRHTSWRARFVDPENGRQIKVRLDPLALSTAELRRDWAIRKAHAIARRRVELESGAPRATGTSLADGIDSYFKAHPQLRDKTRIAYRCATDKLVAWGKESQSTSLDDLTRASLVRFRDTLIRQPKRSSAPFGRRGASRVNAEPRGAHSVNRDLRAVRTVLGYLHDLDLLPRCSFDDLRRGLKRLPTPMEQIEYLRPRDLQRLLQAALRHDADTYAKTRVEHAGLRPLGTTRRFPAIAPFIATVLLTGMRLGEAIELEWAHVDLDALDHKGTPAGEIRLRGAQTKTHRARTVGLEVSPLLSSLLATLKLARGGKGSVFGLTKGEAVAAAKRLLARYGAPECFGWQALRRTCGTYLTNAPGIFDAASSFRSAKQLGHSVSVAERHYVGLVRGITREARSLETAMQIEGELRDIIAAAARPRATPAGTARHQTTPCSAAAVRRQTTARAK